ncbi:MAG: extracellular solute-binding protein [Caldilineaceae bacterium]|nr:extracellular solute-binding protein [Caldilineaceae bacterium]
MKRLQTLKVVLAVLVVFTMLIACAGPQPPAATTPAAGAGAATEENTGAGSEAATEEPAEDTAEAEQAEQPAEVEEFELSAETPPLAPEAEGIEYSEVTELAYEGEITMYAQAYTPVEPTVNLPNPPRYLNRIVAEYQALHPNIKITLIPPLSPGSDYITWVRTQAAGAQLPDIVWLQAGQVNEQLPRGMFEPLTDYLEQSNPYVPEGQPGRDRWFDGFEGFVMEFVQASDGNWYQVNGDYVGTAIFYNKDMFTEAGLDPETPPQTWSEFMAAHQALQNAGMQAFAFPLGPSAFIWSWWHRVGATQFYGDRFDELNVDNNQFRLSPYALARNYATGTWQTSDPRYQETFRILKDWSQYWVEGALSMDIDDTFRMFVNGDVAMYWNGSWAVPQTLDNPDVQFEWATFPLPTFDEDYTEFAVGIPAPMIGGPSAAFQYSISTQQADSTMSPEKLEAAVDFLKFLTAPQSAGPMVNDLGSFIPTIQGTKPLPTMTDLIESMSNTETMGLMELTIEEGEANFRLLQEFMGDQTDMTEYMAKVEALMQETVEGLAAENGWDWDNPPTQE